MRVRVFLGFALAILVFLAPVARGDTAFKPAAMLRIEALENLIGDLRFLVKEVGLEQQAKQIEALLKSRTGPNGLEGVDVKMPIGLYGIVKPALNQSEVMLLLPIADQKTFLEFLDTLNFKPEKDKDDLYTLQIENIPVPLLFRFANGYLYGTAKLNDKMTLPAKDKLPKPETIFAGGSGILSLTANIDQLPEQVRKLGVSSSTLMLGEAKNQPMPGATEKQKALRDALLDEAAGFVKSLLEEGTKVQLKLDLDKTSKDVSLAFTLNGKPGSTLAKSFASLTPQKSAAASIMGKDSVMGGMLHLAMPPQIKKVAASAIDEAITKALNDNPDPNVKTLLQPVADALRPTATSGTLDLGLDMRGPGKGGKYALILSMQIEKGANVEKSVKELLDKLPADAKEPIKVDVAKEGAVNIHQVKQTNVDPQAKELFGDGPVYLALRDEALFVALGENALDTIKEAIRATPTAGQPLRLTISASRLAPLMARDNKAAPAVAKKAFTETGTDQVRLSITSGERLEVKLSLKTAVLAFASMLERAKGE